MEGEKKGMSPRLWPKGKYERDKEKKKRKLKKKTNEFEAGLE